MPDVKQKCAAQGVDVMGSTPEQFAAYIKEQMEEWGKAVKAACVTPE